MLNNQYVALDGIDGCGKSTQIDSICKELFARNITPVCLMEPTYGRHGAKIRSLMSNKEKVSRARQIELFTRDRQEHVKAKIRPLLKLCSKNREFSIIQSRTYLSAPAYQADTEESMFRLLRKQKAIAPKPGMIFLIDVPVFVALRRIRKRRKGSLETKKILEKARHNFLSLVGRIDDNIIVINGNRPAKEVTQRIVSYLKLRRPLYASLEIGK